MSKRIGPIGIASVTILALIAAIVGYFFYVGYAPHLLLNPTTRYLYPLREAGHGTRIDLIPGLFRAGELRNDLISRLKDAGFEDWGNYQRYLDPESTVTDILRISAGGNIVCGYDFFVELSFEADLLQAAQAVRSGGCL